jgi:hypothetical protein
MKFLQESLLVRTGDGQNFTLAEPLRYQTNAGTIITAPAGTTTDGASTPRATWPLLPPFGKYWLAAVLHDYLYRYTYLPQDYCDGILLEAMRSLGVPEATCLEIYDGVRVGGWTAIAEDRKALDQAHSG